MAEIRDLPDPAMGRFQLCANGAQFGYNGENVFRWQMRDEAILALEQLGWV